MKPAAKSRGRGINVINDISSVIYGEPMIMQRYLKNPLLLNGYKFDLRIYVLVTSVNPLEIFIYKEGFAEYYKELRDEGIPADRNIPNTAAKQLGWHHSGGNYLDKDKVLSKRTGESLRRNPIFFGGKKRKPGRNQRLVDPRRMALLMRNENDNPIPAFARPIRPKGHEGRSLRPF